MRGAYGLFDSSSATKLLEILVSAALRRGSWSHAGSQFQASAQPMGDGHPEGVRDVSEDCLQAVRWAWFATFAMVCSVDHLCYNRASWFT